MKNFDGVFFRRPWECAAGVAGRLDSLAFERGPLVVRFNAANRQDYRKIAAFSASFMARGGQSRAPVLIDRIVTRIKQSID
jgi:hypothetical protein